MGNFNRTCVISQLPILGDEPCRIVFIKQHKGWRTPNAGFGSISELWDPVNLPILGKYNDYGALDRFDPESWVVQQFLLWLNQNIQEQEQGENPVHDKPITRPVSLDKLQEFIAHQGDRVGVRNYEQKKELLGCAFIREDIYQGLVNTPIEKSNTEGIQKEIEDDLDIAWETLLQIQADVTATTIDKIMQFGTWRRNHVEEPKHNLWGFEQPLLRTIVGQAFHEMEFGKDAATVMQNLRANAKTIAEYIMLCWHMKCLNKFWCPQCDGGQSNDMAEQKLLRKLMGTAMRTIETRYDDTPPEMNEVFWQNYNRPRVYRSNSRFWLGAVRDALELHIPGLDQCKGDGDGYGTLYMVDDEPEANLGHDIFYYIVSEEGTVEPLFHNFPLNEFYMQCMVEIPPSEWPT